MGRGAVTSRVGPNRRSAARLTFASRWASLVLRRGVWRTALRYPCSALVPLPHERPEVREERRYGGHGYRLLAAMYCVATMAAMACMSSAIPALAYLGTIFSSV